MAEFPVYASAINEDHETVVAGIADAMTMNEAGQPDVVIDWKSDVAPEPRRLGHYQAQVRAYLEMTGAGRGLLVFMTLGHVIHVSRKISPG
jgi:exodeoxyribonuclease-5